MLPLIIAALGGIVGYNLLLEWLKSQETTQEQSPVPFYLIIILLLAIILAIRR